MSTTEEAKVFTLFPELIPELRLQIWEAALPNEPRLVALWLNRWRTGVDGNIEDAPEEEQRFMRKNPPPILLQVCRESREVALKKYSVHFKTSTQQVPIYIDPLLDTVYPSTIVIARDPQLVNIRHIAGSLTIRGPKSRDCVADPVIPPGQTSASTAAEHASLLRQLPHLIDFTYILHGGRCLLHVERQFRTIEFSDLEDLGKLKGFKYRHRDRAIEAEKAAHPEWKIPGVFMKRLIMRDDDPTCREEVDLGLI